MHKLIGIVNISVMNKKILLGLAVLLLLGGGYFFMNKKSTPDEETQMPSGSQNETQGESKTPGSLKDLLTSSIAQKCTYSQTDNGLTSEGTVYVSGGKVRSDFRSTTSGKTMATSMITDGKTIYLWGDQLGNAGIKMTIDQSASTTTTGTDSTADLNKPMNFNCSAWVVNSSYFEAPANVTFTEGFKLPGM